jgi:hypothetical protein
MAFSKLSASDAEAHQGWTGANGEVGNQVKERLRFKNNFNNYLRK